MMRSQRKDEHVALALAQPRSNSSFSGMRLRSTSIPEFDVNDIELKTTYFGQEFPYPFYINAMTGGSEKTLEINRKLAHIAHEFGFAMSVGSQHAALDDTSLESSFRVVREVNPHGFIIGNVSANATVDMAKRAVSMLQANALGVHVNVAQELTMSEGDRQFKHWIDNIEAIVASVDVPVIVKEVGNGLDALSIQKLYEVGVKYVDISGRGGTNFVWIEDQRRETPRYTYMHDWGLTTLESLIENQKYVNKMEIIASGGISTPLDVVKALVLGSRAVGISSMFLNITMTDDVSKLHQFIEDIKHLMVMINKKDVKALKTCEYALDTQLDWITP